MKYCAIAAAINSLTESSSKGFLPLELDFRGGEPGGDDDEEEDEEGERRRGRCFLKERDLLLLLLIFPWDLLLERPFREEESFP